MGIPHDKPGRKCRLIGNILLGTCQAFFFAAVLWLVNGFSSYSQLLGDLEACYSVITLEPGQELTELATTYHTSVEEILRDNAKSSPLRTGTTLTIKENTIVNIVSRGSNKTWQWPLAGKITQMYGWIDGDFHHGVDIAASTGTKVRAAFAGQVVKTGWLGVYGRAVLLDHGNGIQTLYAHNSQIVVKTGQYVQGGGLIAYSGNTGNSTGPHLHFEVRLDGLTVEPADYLPGRSVASAYK